MATVFVFVPLETPDDHEGEWEEWQRLPEPEARKLAEESQQRLPYLAW